MQLMNMTVANCYREDVSQRLFNRESKESLVSAFEVLQVRLRLVAGKQTWRPNNFHSSPRLNFAAHPSCWTTCCCQDTIALWAS